MVATRTYLTGGVGSRHRDEAFGDPFELPPDRAYAETCAAIASVMLAWRLLLATGDPATPTSSSGRSTTASCRACRSTGRASSTSTRCSGGRRARRRTTAARRAPAVVPVRLLPAQPHARCSSSWEQYLATDRRRRRSSVHQYATAELHADVAGGTVAARDRDRLSVGRPVARHGDRGAGAAVDAVAAGPGWCRSRLAARDPDGERTRSDAGDASVDGDADLASR